MLCFPNCKINLGLYITRKRDDGYHDLETVFYPVPARQPGLTPYATSGEPSMCDVLEIIPGKEPAMHLSGLAVAGSPTDNLVWKAYMLLRAAFPAKVGHFDVYLHKVLPMGAGLGGGSADGSFMLRLLNDECGLGLTNEELAAFALQLGSDCPFFIYNTPQFAQGRGEQMMPLPIDLSAYRIEIVCPGIHVSTGKAFSMIKPRPAPFDLRTLATLPVAEWKHHIANDFEAPVFAAHPELMVIKQDLYDRGAVYASMSGSGSAVYGLFQKGQ